MPFLCPEELGVTLSICRSTGPGSWPSRTSNGSVRPCLMKAVNLTQDSVSCWLYPPQPKTPTGKPRADDYFLQKAFLWMPQRMFRIPVCCTRNKPLMSKGLYNRIRDLDLFVLRRVPTAKVILRLVVYRWRKPVHTAL